MKPGAKTQTQLTFGGFVEILWKHPNDTFFYGTTRDTPPVAGPKIAGIDLVGSQLRYGTPLRTSLKRGTIPSKGRSPYLDEKRCQAWQRSQRLEVV